MLPLFFGPPDRRLYGLYHPAVEPRKNRGVLLLNPWGWEALRSHRTLRVLADRLADAGLDVLRFDYSCTGDSMGRHDDARLPIWIDDAVLALEELLVLSGARRVTLIGLRMGALLTAMLVERRRREFDRVALWSAPLTGEEALAWAEEGPEPEARAFPVPKAFRDALSRTDLQGLRSFRGHVLIVGDEQHHGIANPRSVATLGPPAGLLPCWVEDHDNGAGAVPVQLLRDMVAWCVR